MYNRNKAYLYAKEWAYKINPKFYDFSNLGGDCTNFVSQCVFSGIGKMDYNEWFYKDLFNRTPSWTGVEEFWNYGIKNKTNEGFKLKEITLNEVEIGDIIELFNPKLNRYYHNLIVTKIIYPISIQNVLVSAHDLNSFNRSLIDYKTNYFRIGKIF